MELFASDFDGTLHFPGGGISLVDRKAIQRFRAQGNLFGLCTGRSPQSLWPPLDAGGPMKLDFYVLCSGALILDGERKMIASSPIPESSLKAMLALCRTILSGRYVPAFGSAEYFYEIEPFSHSPYTAKHRMNPRPMLREEEFENGCHPPIYTIAMDCGTEAAAKEAVCALAPYGEETGLAFYQNTQFIDTVRIGCSKGSGIRAVCRYLNFGGTPACIGDSYNDLSMFGVTPLSFTFCTSPAAVQAKARFRVDSVAQSLRILEELSQKEQDNIDTSRFSRKLQL